MCKQAVVRQIEPTPSKFELMQEYLHNALTAFQIDPPCGSFQRGFEEAIKQADAYSKTL